MKHQLNSDMLHKNVICIPNAVSVLSGKWSVQYCFDC